MDEHHLTIDRVVATTIDRMMAATMDRMVATAVVNKAVLDKMLMEMLHQYIDENFCNYKLQVWTSQFNWYLILI